MSAASCSPFRLVPQLPWPEPRTHVPAREIAGPRIKPLELGAGPTSRSTR